MRCVASWGGGGYGGRRVGAKQLDGVAGRWAQRGMYRLQRPLGPLAAMPLGLRVRPRSRCGVGVVKQQHVHGCAACMEQVSS